MPGKHYKGMPKKDFDFKSEKPKNKKNYNSKSAEQISEEVTMSAFDKYKTKKEPINKGIGNYKGSGNFAMKNKVLAKSARYGGPMQKNFLGKVGKAMMGPAGMLLAKKPLEAQATSQIVDSKVSGKEQVANLTKHKPKNSETNKGYQRAMNLAKQRAKSEREDSEKA